MMWANLITVSRVPLGACVAFLLMADAREGLVLALILACLMEATDALDGMVARALKQTSALGAMLDPLADSLSRLFVFAAFLQIAWIPYWALMCFIVRDVVVAYARIYGASRGLAVGALLSGKIKAVAQGGAIIGAIGLAIWGGADFTSGVAVLVWIAAAITLWSMVDYLRHFVWPQQSGTDAPSQ